jgi:phage-Barnase-EndoU-ColicinE5/D-RelE like nuclease1
MHPLIIISIAALLFKRSKNSIGSTAAAPEYFQFYHNAAAAIKFLMQQQKGIAVAALHHPKLGDIDLVWGMHVDARQSGYGLAKIVAKHPEVIGALQSIFENMTVANIDKKRSQIVLQSNNYKAVVQTVLNGENRRWLMTAFKKTKPGN